MAFWLGFGIAFVIGWMANERYALWSMRWLARSKSRNAALLRERLRRALNDLDRDEHQDH